MSAHLRGQDVSTYITYGTNDFAQSLAFYDAVLATIGWSMITEFAGWRGYGKGGQSEPVTFWICEPFNGAAATAGNGVMMGFDVATRAEVDAFYRAAMDLGAMEEGAPGLRPHYGPNWYSAYLRDPTGNKLAAVCLLAE